MQGQRWDAHGAGILVCTGVPGPERASSSQEELQVGAGLWVLLRHPGEGAGSCCRTLSVPHLHQGGEQGVLVPSLSQ